MPKEGDLLRLSMKQGRTTKKQGIKRKDLELFIGKSVEAPSEWEKREAAIEREKVRVFSRPVMF